MLPPLRPEDYRALERTDSAIVTPLGGADSHERTVRVLHVDDDPGFADLTADMLERIDGTLAVVTETEASEAVARLEASSIDCVVSDYDMPGLDGLGFLDVVRDRAPELPFVLFTGKGSEEIAGEAIARGVTDYLQKRTGTEQFQMLANRIWNAVDRYRTHEELLTTLSWYQRLVEQNLVGIYLVKGGDIVYVNERFAEIFGYPRAELIGESALMLVDESDRALVAENLRKRERGQLDTIQYGWTGVTEAGERISLEVQGGVVDLDGEPAIMGILLDVGRP